MIKALTAILLGLAVVAAVMWVPPVPFYSLIIVVAGLGALEFSKMFFTDAAERMAVTFLVLLSAGSMLFYANSPDFIVPVVGIIVFLACLFFMWRTSELSGVAQRIGLAVFAIMYLGFAFPMWGVIRLLPNGASLVLLALVPATLCDTFAFLAGKIFGRHKFAPSVSPNKTMEGFVGALLGSLMGTFVIKFLLLPELAAVHVVAISFIVWITSPFGDLIESMLKRSCGVKDSGTIIPGHGGVLDRLDALIFTGPAAYLYIRYVILPQLSPLI